MFEFVRTHKKWMQLLLVLLIAPSFILVGVSEYGGRNAGAASEVANVGNQKISQQQWDDAVRRSIDNARARAGAQFDPKPYETPEAKQRVLESLVVERAVETELAKTHMTVADNTIIKHINDMPNFKKQDGTFDLELYKQILTSQGISPIAFQEQQRRLMTIQQLEGAIQYSGFAPRSVATRIAEFTDQEREVQEMLFPAAQFLPQVQVTDAMIKAYYDKNAALFQIPEQVKAEYVVFDAAVVEKQVTVSDAEALEFYNKNKANFTTKEQRSASHIFISNGKDKAAAKARAEAIAAEVRAAPATFADVAKAKSDDKDSGAQGGDLGDISKGLPKSVEAAAKQMKLGEISNPVESEFGYHVLTVTKLTPEVVRPFDQAKTEVVAEVKRQKMSKKYSELAEQFSNLVYEQSDSLKPAADKLGIEIKTVSNLTRTPSPALGDAPYNNAKFLTALFSTDAIRNKRNTEAVEAAPTVLIAGRVIEHTPAAKRALAEVEPVIRQRVAQEEAVKLAKAAGEAKIAAAKASGDAAGFGEPKVLKRTAPPTVSPVAAPAVLKADVSKLPAYVGVELPGVGYGVYRIGKVIQPAQTDAAKRAQIIEQINGLGAQGEFTSYLEALKVKAKSKINAKPVATAEVK